MFESGGVKIEGENQTIWEGRLELGGDSVPMGSTIVAPYVGVGYRRWNNEVLGLYDEITEYLHLPLGMNVYWVLGAGWTMITRFEGNIILWGRVTEQFSDIPGIDYDLKYDLSGGYGAEAEFLVRKRLGHNLSFSVRPFVRYWTVDDSELESTFSLFFIPANETGEAGVRLKISI